MNFTLIIYFFSNFFLIFFSLLFLLPLIIKTKKEYDLLKKYIFGNIIHVFIGMGGIILGCIVLVFPYDRIILLGDFIPAVCLLLVSITLVFGYIRISKSIENEMLDEGQVLLDKFQIPIGILGMVAGVAHIFFPGIVLL